MIRRFIPVEESFVEWRKDPEFMKAYDALEEEFALASQSLAATRGQGEGRSRKPTRQRSGPARPNG